MKRICFIGALVMLAVTAGYSQQIASATPKENPPSFMWVTEVHDFGKVVLGTPVTHEFVFTNNGTGPLVLATVKASCGCTTPSWTKDPILPGEKGFIKATYNTGTVGVFNKTITVSANVDGNAVVLTIKGEVIR